ncbi:MAG TPA: PGPGW domain-containing protein [Myxococcales bacterium]|nr:PGPGW domain-containing protein [Myxococcales bacterium]
MEAVLANVRRIAAIAGGGILLVTGIALLVLPGPGVPLIIAGLALLSTQFEWARRLRDWLRRRVHAAAERFRHGDDAR